MSTRVFSISVFRPVLPLLQPEPWVSKPEPGDPFGLLGYYYHLLELEEEKRRGYLGAQPTSLKLVVMVSFLLPCKTYKGFLLKLIWIPSIGRGEGTAFR